MRVRIYQPSRSTMQSGRGKTRHWLVEAELATPRQPEPLMGWISSGDSLGQLKMRFATQEEAVGFAKRNGWEYTLQNPNLRRVRPRSYMDNFRPGFAR